ncbi:MAG: amino acid adenylation domain-containing protein [Candidatus Peregrinibacteria bacterium]|nr:amino acid adenylation domain-containing protein [Candidatus Peregrinibacteria bacterium]
MSQKDIEDIYELSPMQQGMLFHSLASPESGAYSNRISYILKGDLDIPAFERAWQKVVDRHPVFRSSFHSEDFDKPLQVVHKQARLSLEQQDWRNISVTEQQERLDTYLKEEGRRGFILTQAPLMRLALFRCSEDTYQFVMSQHHLLMDGWCRPLIFKEASTFYEAFRHGKDIQLELPRPYRDYILWLQQQDMAKVESFWRNELKGFSSPTPLVTNRNLDNHPAKEDDFAKQKFELPKETTDAIKALARKHGLTLNTLFQGLWALLISRYSGEEDVVFGATVSGRPPALRGVESMIGLFINTLPVRVRIDKEIQLLQWLKALQSHQIEVREYEHSPLMNVQHWSDVPRSQPLFESILIFENFPEQANGEGNASLNMQLDRFFDWTNYPLTIEVVPDSELLILALYDCRLFDDGTITRMLGHLKTMLEGVVSDPFCQLSKLPYLTQPEREQLLVKWNLTKADYPKELCLHELIELQVERNPERLAVNFEEQSLTYRELNERSNQLAHFLMNQGVKPGTKVGVLLDRDENMLVGLLGILKAGGAYVPLDPSYPLARIEYMIKDSGAPILLTAHHLLASIPHSDSQIICLDLDWQEIEQMPETNTEQTVSTEQLAYVIYTSGSTGHPKGVQVTHANVVNFIHSVSSRPGFSADDALLAITTISFDIHVLELFLPLYCGGKVVIASQHDCQDGRLLLQLIRERNISVMQATPATWWMMIQAGWEEALPLKAISGGEKLTEELASALFPRVQKLWNLYGPTETTVWSAGAEITYKNEPITIQQVVNNTELYILDSSMELVPIGVSGELFIGGLGVTQGYLNRPELTEKNFIENPFEGFEGKKIYRTGDLARYLPNGRIQLLGRSDHQVKLRGYRIETGEIEKTLETYDAVNQAVVTLREDQPGNQRLVAYLLGAEDEANNLILREWLRQNLPDYMVPSTFVWLEEFPKTPNNKVDRKALPEPSQNSGNENPENYVLPQSPLESLLVDIFKEVLKIDYVGCYDNFFDLGGHSLLSLKVVSRFEKATGIHMHPGELFQQTIGQIAATYEQSYSLSLK